MLYNRLGDTGLIVSRLGFGAMTFTGGGRPIPSVAKVDQDLAQQLVDRAIDGGINFFDTADVYDAGQSEVILGRTLAARRKDVVLATKVGVRNGRTLTRAGLSRRHIMMSIDESLERLGTDWVDLYILHQTDPHVRLEETLDALDAVVRSGKARYIGFSNWPAWQAATAVEMQRANGWARFTHGQYYYSLLGRDIEREIIPMLGHHGLGLTLWSPLAFGFLSGKFTRENLMADGSRFVENDMFGFDKEEGFRLVETMDAMAKDKGGSVAQVALAWLLSRPAVSSILLGTSKLAQLDDNLGAIGMTLSEDELRTLDGLTAPAPTYPQWMIDRFSDRRMAAALADADRR